MTTKFLDNKIFTFKILLSWRFPWKIAFWTIFLPAPLPNPPRKSANFIFIVVSLSLNRINDAQKRWQCTPGRAFNTKRLGPAATWECPSETGGGEAKIVACLKDKHMTLCSQISHVQALWFGYGGGQGSLGRQAMCAQFPTIRRCKWSSLCVSPFSNAWGDWPSSWTILDSPCSLKVHCSYDGAASIRAFQSFSDAQSRWR